MTLLRSKIEHWHSASSEARQYLLPAPIQGNTHLFVLSTWDETAFPGREQTYAYLGHSKGVIAWERVAQVDGRQKFDEVLTQILNP